jgi:hypothetical protein
MPEPTIPGISATTDPNEIADQLAKIQKYLNWLLSSLDSLNVKEITTNFTRVHSRYGETVIDGPQLLMYDQQATPQLRLEQGYDDVTGDFLFRLYNPVGENVLTLSSAGEIVLSGKPLFEMYDNQTTPVKRLVMGYDELTGDFLFELYNKAGVKTVGIDSNGNATFTGTITGSVITGGTIRTGTETEDRIELSGGKFAGYMYDSTAAASKITGLYFDITTIAGTGIADIYLYHNDTALVQMYDDITGYIIRGAAGATRFGLGGNGVTTYCYGPWNFAEASSIAGLVTDAVLSHSHTVDIGGTIYTTSSDGGHSHSVIIG